MVDLVGIEPTTSSMPWKRAPSCATGPLVRTLLLVRMTSFIFAESSEIVNAAVPLLDRRQLLCPEQAPVVPYDRFFNATIRFLRFLPQAFSAIIDRARHLHNFPKTI